MKHWPFKVINKQNRPMIEISLKDGPKQFAAEEISAMVLGYMKKIAEVRRRDDGAGREEDAGQPAGRMAGWKWPKGGERVSRARCE
jgi:hypothetical protein